MGTSCWIVSKSDEKTLKIEIELHLSISAYVYVSVHRFWRNSPLFDDVTWKTSILNFITIWQEVQKTQAKLQLCLSVHLPTHRFVCNAHMQHQHKVQSFYTELKPSRQRNIKSRSINSFIPSKWSIAFTTPILTKLKIVQHPVNNSRDKFYKNPSNSWLAGTRSWQGVVSTYDTPFFFLFHKEWL